MFSLFCKHAKLLEVQLAETCCEYLSSFSNRESSSLFSSSPNEKLDIAGGVRIDVGLVMSFTSTCWLLSKPSAYRCIITFHKHTYIHILTWKLHTKAYYIPVCYVTTQPTSKAISTFCVYYYTSLQMPCTTKKMKMC